MQMNRLLTLRRALLVTLAVLVILFAAPVCWLRQPPLRATVAVQREELSPDPPRQLAEDSGPHEAPPGTEGRCQSPTDLPLAMMERDVTWSEPWPEMELGVTLPGQVAPALHYVWCGAGRQLLFRHYLGLLSAVRVLKPLKVYFYHTRGPPVVDKLWYNDWLEEFKRAVPVMETVRMDPTPGCGSKEMLAAIMERLTAEGGLYLGENVILAGLPAAFPRHDTWFAFAAGDKDLTRGIAYVRKGPAGAPRQNASRLTERILARRKGCVSVQELNRLGPGEDRRCVLVDNSVSYPRDIWGARTAFGEVARWCFYGRRAPYEVRRDPGRPIPRIAHYIRVRSKERPMYLDEFSFTHFLSILSALYVGGFQHVYLHADKEPGGRWWDELKRENVTVLTLQKPTWVYQQKVTGITHFSDVSRFNILYRYGGAYQDFDCVWTSRVPDDLLQYPTVISPAISRNAPWPDGLALGMLMARPRAPFLRHGFKGYRRYRADNYLYNAIMRSYRTYEHHPDTVLLDPHFTVFCVKDKCFPQWLKQPWDLKKNGGRDYSWNTELRALHLVIPKVWKSFESPAALKKGQDMIADVGRNILRKSGRMSLLEGA